ncbi:MAG: DMT family transporter [Acidobacteria bacterium]|nr:DMT family transporter [Acidobacteriota bacterium]
MLLTLAAMIWGATFVVVKDALAFATPSAFLAVRFTLAGVLLFVFVSRGRLSAAAIGRGCLLGIFLYGGYLFQTTGLLYTTPSKSAFITGFSVVLVPFLQAMHGFKIRKSTIAGAALGLWGIYLLVLPKGLAAVNRGDALTLLGSCAFAVHIVLVGVYTRRHSFRQLVSMQILTVGLLAFFSWPLGMSFRITWTVGLVAAMMVTAVLATGLAFSVQNWAQQFTPPAHTALIFALEPVFAAVTSWIVLGERLGGRLFIGSAMILAGMVISEIWGGQQPSPVEG